MLDLLLGSHPRFVGLGEIFQVIRPDFNRFANEEHCSCGRIRSECPFWGPAAQRLKAHPQADIRSRYQIVFDVFREIYGPGYTAVDSSKLAEALGIVRSLQGIDPRVIFMIRDVRGWTVSRLAARNRSPEYYRREGNYVRRLRYHYGWKAEAMKWIVPRVTKRPVYYFLLWYHQNRRIKRFLSQHRIDHLQMSYDELGMAPEPMIQKLFGYLAENDFDPGGDAVESRSHILVGSIRKSDPRRRRGILYDNRWMYRNEWILPAALFPAIMRYNQREVYPRRRDAVIWA